MKALAAALLSTALVAGGMTAVWAQAPGSSTTSPSTVTTPAPTPSNAADSSASTSSAADTKSSSSDVKSSSGVKTDNDNAAALPRSAVDRNTTTIFGLSPTAAIIIAVALLLVVILAIVPMTRSSDSTYIDTSDRRM